MNCKHVRVKGKTTKYYYCMLKNKTVDDYSCKNCVMKLPDFQKGLRNCLERDLEDEYRKR